MFAALNDDAGYEIEFAILKTEFMIDGPSILSS